MRRGINSFHISRQIPNTGVNLKLAPRQPLSRASIQSKPPLIRSDPASLDGSPRLLRLRHEYALDVAIPAYVGGIIRAEDFAGTQLHYRWIGAITVLRVRRNI
jgi:hypothetical protein